MTTPHLPFFCLYYQYEYYCFWHSLTYTPAPSTACLNPQATTSFLLIQPLVFAKLQLLVFTKLQPLAITKLKPLVFRILRPLASIRKSKSVTNSKVQNHLQFPASPNRTSYNRLLIPASLDHISILYSEISRSIISLWGSPQTYISSILFLVSKLETQTGRFRAQFFFQTFLLTPAE